MKTFLYKYSIFIALLSMILFGISLGFSHLRWFLVGIVGFFSLIFVGIAMEDMIYSRRLPLKEKLVWLLAFLFFNGFAGLIYYHGYLKKRN